ncbi:MAG: hypothetical protein KGJ12_07615, partial [Gammaproteobacteria bacterium]|nr:hypothetical protein [Gammaproteobacteria bacterium]
SARCLGKLRCAMRFPMGNFISLISNLNEINQESSTAALCTDRGGYPTLKQLLGFIGFFLWHAHCLISPPAVIACRGKGYAKKKSNGS